MVANGLAELFKRVVVATKLNVEIGINMTDAGGWAPETVGPLGDVHVMAGENDAFGCVNMGFRKSMSIGDNDEQGQPTDLTKHGYRENGS